MFIADEAGGRLGNKLMYYNNICQIAYHFDHKFLFPNFLGCEIFNFQSASDIEKYKITEELTAKDLICMKNSHICESRIIKIRPCLGDLFFIYDSLSTFDIFQFNQKYIPVQNMKKNVAIHFRGTDTASWDKKAVFEYEYYKNAIDLVLTENDNLFFKIITDDLSLETVKRTVQYFDNNHINYQIADSVNTEDVQKDFIDIAFSDIVISSYSTFCITSCFCGLKNKKIIHSKKWIDYKCNQSDSFWVSLKNGGNSNYKLYKTI